MILEDENVNYEAPIAEFQARYCNMTDYIVSKKQVPLKSADNSNNCFIFNDKMLTETKNYMKNLSKTQVKYTFENSNKI